MTKIGREKKKGFFWVSSSEMVKWMKKVCRATGTGLGRGRKRQGKYGSEKEIESSRLGKVGWQIDWRCELFLNDFPIWKHFLLLIGVFFPIRLARLTRCDVTSIIQCRSAFKAVERRRISVFNISNEFFTHWERKASSNFFLRFEFMLWRQHGN